MKAQGQYTVERTVYNHSLCNSIVDNSQYLDKATGLENVQMVSQIQQKNRQYTKLDGKCE